MPRKTRNGCSCGFRYDDPSGTHRLLRKCPTCGATRVRKYKPKHRAALNHPYSYYLALNGGVEACGICGARPTGERRLHRDHDHRSGEPRGLLDFRCNAALRPYMDAAWLAAALEYVTRSEHLKEAA